MKKQRQSALLAFLDVDLSKFDSAETSSDESFKIENHTEGSDDGSSDESDSESDSEDESDEKSSDEEPGVKEHKASDVNQPSTSSSNPLNITEKHLEHTKSHTIATAKLLSTLVCCACLGDRSDDSNEIVECDGCKITVHEGCYGVSESVSVSSTVSSCSTEPWFCEACKANVKDPDCELCPNRGGIFKETDCGKWVHLVCALYVPGVAFGEVDQLSMVTLFEMQYNKWGAKLCSLCDDERFGRTGVCIGCDAGMCKTYFHVTCAQKAGLLSEAHHEEVDQADPFYAHCKVHSDKTLVKNRKRNYNTLLVQMKHHQSELELGKNEKPTPEQERIERKLKKHRNKYTTNKINRVEPWVPTQKMPRLLNTSASACKKLMKKAELMGIDAAALEFQEAQIASLTDIRKKWHIPPAFSTEFVGYYLDRSIRIDEMKTNLGTQLDVNTSLISQQQILRTKYDDAIKVNQEVQQHQKDLIAEIEQLHNAISQLCPSASRNLPSLESIGKPVPLPLPTVAAIKTVSSSPAPTLSSTPPPQMIASRTMSVPTAAALKMGVGFPLHNLRKDDTGRILSTQCLTNSDELLNECGICKKCSDQHLLSKCDTCHLYYHLGCLNPPLTRHPKRSKLYAWQCSECDNSDDSAPEKVIIPKGPRRSRIRYSKDGPIIPDPLRDSLGSEKSMISVPKKSGSVHRNMNGNEKETLEVKDVPILPETPINCTLASESVPTTSTPIDELSFSDSKTDENSTPKKRGRRAKTKSTPTSSNDSLTAIDLTAPSHSTPSKETTSENHLEHDLNSFNEQELIVSKMSTVVHPELEISPSGTGKIPKKGRPRKEKPSITQISNKLQKKQQINQQVLEPQSEVTLLDLSRKIECPLEQFRAFADIPNSIPYPAPTIELPKVEPEPIPVISVITANDTTMESNGPMNTINPLTNGVLVNGEGSSSVHHKHKKRKSHKRRHSHSPSSGERQPSGKKHKRKRKRKTHDLEEEPSVLSNSMDSPRLPEQPRIKMKFCAKFVQAGDDKKIMWSLPSARDAMSVEPENNHAEIINNSPNQTTRQSSISTVKSPKLEVMTSPVGNGHSPVSKKRKKPQSSGSKKARLVLNISPNKGISAPVIAPSHFPASVSSTPSSTMVLNEAMPIPTLNCDVCQMPGLNQNLVKCDECQKNYHFTCLIPPLKKTPKKRGYSWHCADCDPTDREFN